MVSLLMVRKKSLSRRVRESLSDHCGQLGADDGVDPNEFFKSSSSQSTCNKKAIQLCRQVRCCLSLVLGDCDDPIVQSLSVVDVILAPDSSRLLVVLAVDEPQLEMDRDQVLARVNLQLPRLRSEIARSIHRKRVPVLILQVVPRQSLTEGERNE